MFEYIKALLLNNFDMNGKEILPNSNLINDLELDSITLFELVCLIEEDGGNEINDSQISKFVVVQDLVDYLLKEREKDAI